MPECVEVEVTRRKIETLVQGRYLKHIKTQDPLLPDLRSCHGLVKGVLRHGKILWFDLNGGPGLIVRLSMSGSLLTEEAFGKIKGNIRRVVFEFNRPDFRLVLLDPRRFAKLAPAVQPPRQGLDILSAISQDETWGIFEQILRVSRGKIKNLLMNQSKIAGLGNAYANEIVFEARIGPKRVSCRLKQEERRALWLAAAKILGRSLQVGGISMRNFFHPDGQRGLFQSEFRIYGRKKGSPCFQCGSPVKVFRQSQRSTFWCSKCQK